MELSLRRLEELGVIRHDVVDHATKVPARIRVVTDTGDSVGRKVPRADVEYFLLDNFRNPGKTLHA